MMEVHSWIAGWLSCLGAKMPIGDFIEEVIMIGLGFGFGFGLMVSYTVTTFVVIRFRAVSIHFSPPSRTPC